MKKRIISAIIAAAVVVPIFIIGGMAFSVLVGILAVLAYKEIVDLKSATGKIPNIVKGIGLINLLMIVFYRSNTFGISSYLSYQLIGLTITTLLLPIIFYKKNYESKDALYLIGWTLFLGVFFNSLILITTDNKIYLIYLLLITVLTDTFAYIIGMLIGKTKVTEISPNKSLEGYIAGSVVGTFVGTMFYVNLINGDINLLKIIAITLAFSILGQLGDLVFSKIKRENDKKDFSKLMPGHGGVLDRLDSLIFVTIAFIILFTYI